MFSSVIAVFMLAVAAYTQNATVAVDTNNTMTNNDVTTPMMMMSTTTSMMVDGGDNNNTDAANTTMAAPVTTTTVMTTDQPDEPTTTPGMPVTTTTIGDVPCNNSIGRLTEIYDFTKTKDFKDTMTQSEQILIFETLAAAEGCTMSTFIKAETSERIFRMLGSLPVRHVYIFLNYLAEALENEGVVIPPL